jgi:hypothetical protein
MNIRFKVIYLMLPPVPKLQGAGVILISITGGRTDTAGAILNGGENFLP